MRQHVRIGPAGVAFAQGMRSPVVVLALAAHVHHCIDRAAAAQRPRRPARSGRGRRAAAAAPFVIEEVLAVRYFSSRRACASAGHVSRGRARGSAPRRRSRTSRMAPPAGGRAAAGDDVIIFHAACPPRPLPLRRRRPLAAWNKYRAVRSRRSPTTSSNPGRRHGSLSAVSVPSPTDTTTCTNRPLYIQRRTPGP